MKDADYRVRDGEEFEEERVRMRYRHEDQPCKRLKDYVMAFAIGVGVGMGAMMFWYDKTHRVEQKKETYETIATNFGELLLTDKQEQLVRKGLKDIERKAGWYDKRIRDNWFDILGRHGPNVSDENIKKVIDDTLNPATPIGRLLNKYRGPKVASQPSQSEEEQFEELCQKYELYQPSIDALMDENHDNQLIREERNKGVYKLFHQ